MSPEQQRAAMEAIRRALEGRTPTPNVLVVEDVREDAELTVSTLREYGLKPQWARNMAEVLKAIQTTDYTVVFLDLKLTGDSGLNILKAIKTFKPDTKVVVLTGAYRHDSDECKMAIRDGPEKSAIAALCKPLTGEHVQFIFGIPT